MNDHRPKRDTMSIEEAMIYNTWGLAALIEEQKGLLKTVRGFAMKTDHSTRR